MNYYTHAGLFHRDEVFGWIVCQIAGVCNNLVRLTSIEDLPTNGILADIGREYNPKENKFDHHQSILRREDGYPYATAGLLWKEFGDIVITELTDITDKATIKTIKNRVDDKLFKVIDAYDADSTLTTEHKCSAGPLYNIANPISIYNHIDVSDHNVQYVQFKLAAEIAMRYLEYYVDEAVKYSKQLLE